MRHWERAESSFDADCRLAVNAVDDASDIVIDIPTGLGSGVGTTSQFWRPSGWLLWMHCSATVHQTDRERKLRCSLSTR